ncbi:MULTISPECIES: DEAD/DEAH box helicase [Actinotignum]|uniref:DEAD/DEAH box helicase n=1 Tax=Actinotignum timonense TaxID=1870995 RepID=A0AAW9H9E2_9ACTO|nr:MULTISPECIES: DEAD/DEAH box helicase [Actinotignum]MDE1557767.1 DEAD/DEAH box helicase [Actinotignum schaalii]MDE1663733.1 DEAD/DEAH box helicase [Actinotignum schaalii]MDK6373572.1 DEAD/DEAH box helicase [Actinotignum timonense]MDK6418626.1 DEAD/DEAH box helicase [Actinotignum timonense]MDK6644365.1 DEAD/DEAH box helicase [Actinotignum timonense]
MALRAGRAGKWQVSLHRSIPASTPHTPSVSAASNLPPAFPARAAWGTTSSLRSWQAEALRLYLERMPRDFLAVATPGAGKTTFALRVAVEMLARHEARTITVVCPTEHLKTQWAQAAARVGIQLDADFTNAQRTEGSFFNGVCVTYAQVAANPALHRERTSARPTFVILDEIHHGGDALSWGDGIREAFTPATRRLALTGTPFRSDTSPIPFVTYEPDGYGNLRSKADYTYGYAQALRDGVVRPVIFLSYSGQVRWQTKQGDVVAATLGEPLTKDMTAQAWRTALNPGGEWIPEVLSAANERLTVVRRSLPDSGGLVIASNQKDARAYAQILTEITGEAPTVVLSDDAGANEKIATFADSDSRWMVAVRMVSEGVDVPRLAVGVYATSASTPLYFAQAIGRFVRARRRGETATVFLPSVPVLLELAAQMEKERDHAISKQAEVAGWDDDLLEAANREEKASEELEGPGYEALESGALFDRALFDGGEFGLGAAVGSEEEADFLGIPGLLEPEEVTTLLRAHQAEQAKKARSQRPAPGADELTRRRTARKELTQLVAAWAKKTGDPHALIHTELRRACGGPEVARASADQIEARVKTLRRWFVGQR